MSQFVVRRPRVIIGIIIALSAFFGVGLSRGLELDVSPLTFVAHQSQERREFAEARKAFGGEDYLLIAVVCDDVFSADNLGRLRNLHRQIEGTKGVAEVLSLSNAPYARSLPQSVSVEHLIPESLTDSARLAEARQVATSDRLYLGNFVSADARTAALNVLIKPDLPTAERHELTRRIYEFTHQAGFRASYFAGDPFSQWRSTEAIKKDLLIFLPMTVALIGLLLWLCFRSVVAVALPLLTIGIGLLWLLGLMAYFHAHFTILGLMLPTLMLAIGCSYMIHVLNQIGIATCILQMTAALDGKPTTGAISSTLPGQFVACDPQEVLKSAMGFINLPVIVSALTIIAGFLSLAFTEIPAIRSTGIYAAVGAAFTMILSLTFIPAVLAVLPARAMAFRSGLTGGMVKLLEDTGRWATAHQKLLYILTAIIIVLSLIGVRRIRIDIDYFHFFKSNAEPSIGLAEINKRLLGPVTFEVIVASDRPGAMETPDVLRRIAQLQEFAEQRKNPGGQGIDRALSIVDFVKTLNRAFHNNDPGYYSIPADERVLDDLLSDRDQLKGFLTADGSKARILIRSNLFASQAMAQAIREVGARGRELLPEFRVYATGTFVLLNRTSDQIAGEQEQSIVIALVTIFLMLTMLFRSLRVGVTALVPNLIPVLLFFGFMGWRGIPLNLTTSLVASVVLGLAVDNAVQFIVRFRRVQTKDSPLRDSIIESMRLSGRPIIYANIALAATFAIFALSNFEPVSSFGLLSAVTIIGCLVEDLVLLPSRLTSPVFRAK